MSAGRKIKHRARPETPVNIVSKVTAWGCSYSRRLPVEKYSIDSDASKLALEAQFVYHDSAKLRNYSSTRLTIFVTDEQAASSIGYVILSNGEMDVACWISSHGFTTTTQLLSSGNAVYVGVRTMEFAYRKGKLLEVWFDTRFIESDWF